MDMCNRIDRRIERRPLFIYRYVLKAIDNFADIYCMEWEFRRMGQKASYIHRKIGKWMLLVSMSLVFMLTVIACDTAAKSVEYTEDVFKDAAEAMPGESDSDKPDIFVESIEVSQAIQDSANSVVLVSDRSTVVRVRVGVDGGGSATGIDGVLHVFVDGVQITTAVGVAPINSGFTAPETGLWNRDNEDHTLNFEISAPTGITPTTDADFVVALMPLPGEPDTTNNSGSAVDLAVVESLTPKLYFTRINYTPAGAGLPDLSDVQAGAGNVFVDGIYPIDDSDPIRYQMGIFPSLTWSADPNGNSQVDSSNNEHSDILDWLESCRQLIVDAEGNGDRIFLYGWIKGNPIGGNGWAPVGGRVAFGNTQETRHQRTYAHELGHNFGLSHNARKLAPDTGWDTGARLEDNPTGNNTNGRVKPSVLWDIMRGGRLTNQAWIDQTNYEYFLGHDVLDSGGTGSSDRSDRRDKRLQQRVVAVSGVLDFEGTKLVRLNPVFRYPWLSQASINDPQGQYTVQVETQTGNVFESTFSGELGDDSDSPQSFGFFSARLAVPAEEEIVRVIIISLTDRRELGRLERSGPPRIRILDPADGAQLTGEVTVKFDVEDSDTPKERIRVQIAYSNDNGVQWVPVAVNVPASVSAVTFDSKQVQPSKEGSGVIRVIASDGLNTVFDDVSKLTVGGQ